MVRFEDLSEVSKVKDLRDFVKEHNLPVDKACLNADGRRPAAKKAMYTAIAEAWQASRQLTARTTGAGATPGAPATGAPTASPHLPTHSDAPVPALAAALNVGDRVIVRAPLESSCKYEGRVAFVYSLHGTECRLLLDDHPPRPDDPIRGVITGMVSQTVCVTIKKAVPQPEPGRWRLENAYLVARLSPVSSEWQIGMRVQVSMGEYAGQTGSILSVHPQSVTLRMDATGQVTGYLRKGAVQAVRAGLTDQFAAAAA